MTARYIFHLRKIDTRGNEATLTINFLPNTKKHGIPQMSQPGDISYDYNQKYKGGKTGRIDYKTPKDAIASIPVDPNLAYRGIAYEEWQNIKKTGLIKSKGHYNLGQEGYTLFGTTPDQAQSYAHGFAPIPYQVGFKKPGIVIAIPKSGLLTHKDDPEQIPGSELALKGSLSISAIKNVWMLVPTQAREGGGFLEFRIPYMYTKNGEILDFKRATTGSGNLGTITNYSIRQII